MAESDPRLFIAVAAPTAVVAELSATRKRLEAAGAPPLRWVRPEGMHLTLRFLGQTPAAAVDGIEAAMREAAAATPAQTPRLGRLELNNRRRPRALWVELGDGAAALARLAERLAAALAERGLAPEGRPFRPHLTLARVPPRLRSADRATLARLLTTTRAPAPLPLPVTALALMESRLGPAGARYARRSQATLRGAPADA